MTRTNKIFLMAAAGLVATAVLGSALPAASQPGHGMGRFFEHMDTNSDGKVSYEEHRVRCDERFSSMDLDSDGFVTKAEAEQARETRQAEFAQKRFEAMDTNGDGSVTKEEAAAEWAKMRGHRRGNCGGPGPMPE